MADFEPQPVELPEVEGHRFTLLAEGAERLEALLALIGGARSRLDLVFYIFAGDEPSARVRDALAAAARRGVRVTLLIDGFGSSLSAADHFFEPLTEAGARFCRYEPKRSRRYLLRNHQKIVIADGERAMIGGFNVGDRYFLDEGEVAWRDLGIAIEGPAVARLVPFCEEIVRWSEERRGEMKELRSMLLRHSEQDGAVRWLLGGPTRELSPWALAFNNDLASSDRVDVVSAYFAPYAALLRRIRKAAQRGQARLIAAGKTDHNVTLAAARNRYRYLLPEVEIYEYQPLRLHTKLYIVDDVVYVGSANLDVRSLYLNLEVMLRIRNADFAAAMRRFIDGEVAHSARITPEAYARSRSLWTRIKGRLAYFLVSVIDYNVSRRLNFGFDGR